jgi:hypothetical protein
MIIASLKRSVKIRGRMRSHAPRRRQRFRRDATASGCSPVNLAYRSKVMVEDLALNECTIHRAVAPTPGVFFWNLWFYVARETDGVPEAFVVPVNPGGSYTENGPGGRTWGFTRTGPTTWQVSPSIDVLNDEDARRATAKAVPGTNPPDAPMDPETRRFITQFHASQAATQAAVSQAAVANPPANPVAPSPATPVPTPASPARGPSLWHQTPAVINVPPGERWMV